MRVLNSRQLVTPHRDVAILLDKNTILLEDETEWPYKATPRHTKIFASKKVIDEIWNVQKVGEVLKYDGNIVKWREKCPSRYRSKISWPNDSLEVTVVNSRSFPDDPLKAVEAYADWRDWVEQNQGNIIGSNSSTSWSIFKASLGGRWETPFQGVPGITHPIGGRLLPCKSLWTTFHGDYIQWDLYSAYTRRLATLAFGGIGSQWKEVSKNANFDRMIERGLCVYIEATVRFGRKKFPVSLGPLPIRRTEYHPRPQSNLSFPLEGTITGIWTYEEVRDAESIGARVCVSRAFVHFATGRRYHHRDWFRIIQEGRNNLSGYSKSLAKQTGNALWGRYAMRIRPAKTVWRNSEGKREWIKHPARTLKRNQCMELADQLCGKIRSDLYELAISAGDNCIQGNTDGAWIKNVEGWKPPSDDWRIKRRAVQIDIIDDATYRYWEEGKETPTYIVPGINSDYTEEYFNRHWERHVSAK